MDLIQLSSFSVFFITFLIVTVYIFVSFLLIRNKDLFIVIQIVSFLFLFLNFLFLILSFVDLTPKMGVFLNASTFFLTVYCSLSIVVQYFFIKNYHKKEVFVVSGVLVLVCIWAAYNSFFQSGRIFLFNFDIHTFVYIDAFGVLLLFLSSFAWNAFLLCRKSLIQEKAEFPGSNILSLFRLKSKVARNFRNFGLINLYPMVGFGVLAFGSNLISSLDSIVFVIYIATSIMMVAYLLSFKAVLDSNLYPYHFVTKISSVFLIFIFMSIGFINALVISDYERTYDQENKKIAESVADSIDQTNFQTFFSSVEFVIVHQNEAIFDEGFTVLYSRDHFVSRSSVLEAYKSVKEVLLGAGATESSRDVYRKIVQTRYEEEKRLSRIVGRDLGQVNHFYFTYYQHRNGKWIEVGFSYLQYRAYIHEKALLLTTVSFIMIVSFLVLTPFLLRNIVIHPVRKLMTVVESINSGNYQVRVKDYSSDEIGIFSRTFNEMIETVMESQQELEDKVQLRTLELRNAMDELRISNQKLDALTMEDGLTKIANRRRLDQVLEQECNRVRRIYSPLVFIMIDIDFFKHYNDSYGHIEGDRVLTAVAKTIGGHVHRNIDVAARFGGEEFAVLLSQTRLEDGLKIAESIRAKVEDLRIPHQHGGGGFVTVSVGVAGVEEEENLTITPEVLIKKADKALYEAKHNGKNRVEITV